MHPDLETSKRSSSTFEEVQFFSNPTNYAKGIEWSVGFFSFLLLYNLFIYDDKMKRGINSFCRVILE